MNVSKLETVSYHILLGILYTVRTLVTGHMGLLGRHFSRTLSNGVNDVHRCDSRSGTDCREAFKVNNLHYDLVIHCAGSDSLLENMAMNAEFFDWVDRTEPTIVVYFSRTGVYPVDLQQEPHRLTENNATPTTETMAELALETQALERGMHVFRPFEVYGEAGTGPFADTATMVAYRVDDFRLKGCGQVLDYIHVDDVVKTVLKAIEDEPRGPVNLCTGEPTAVDELAIQMMESVKWQPKNFRCDAKDEVIFQCGDPTLMNTIRPASVSLLDGIRRHVQ